MALWQYQFTIIPNQYILKDISNDEFEYELWEHANIHKEDFLQVNSFLPKTKSWSENLDIYMAILILTVWKYFLIEKIGLLQFL